MRPAILRLLVAPLVAYLSRLRFPTLFAVTATIFICDLLLPDLIPFVDEILLGLGTALLGSWRQKPPPTGPGGDAPRKDRPPTPPRH